MAIYKEWIDFVLYPNNPYSVQTLEQRLDIKNAIDRDMMLEASNFIELAKKYGMVIKKEWSISKDDEFEAMKVDEKGNVTIWTKKKVGYILRNRFEKVVYILRNPPDEQLS